MSRLLLEVIVQTLDDAREAAEGGADRLEVVRSISQGGLTPALDLIRAIKKETSLPLRVMVRENAGYQTDRGELANLRRAAGEIAALSVDGLVVGFLGSDGAPAIHDLETILGAAPGVPATFHRAFDAVVDPLGAIDLLAAIPQLDRILTSGGDGSVERRCARLNTYADRAHPRLRVIAGGGVTLEMLNLITLSGCVGEIHVGRAARDRHDPEAPVSRSRVQQLRQALDKGFAH